MPGVFDNVRYEGYGPSGTVVVVDGSTRDRERLTAQVRRTFRHWGGYLGAQGSVAYLFNHVGVLTFGRPESGRRLLQVAVQAGAEDVVTNPDGSMQVLTDPVEFEAVRTSLAANEYLPMRAEITWKPATTVALKGEEAVTMSHLLESLRDLTDVHSVYTNAEIPDQVLASL